MKIELLTIREHEKPTYPPRTRYNAHSSDVTLALAVDLTTKGEILTHKMAGDEKYIGIELVEGLETINIARKLYKKLNDNKAQSLNIAGNGAYTLIKAGCTQDFINQYVYEIITQVHHFYPLSKIYTGGQTGVDIAGAVAGYMLEIPTEVTLPQGYKQRLVDGTNIDNTYEGVLEQIQKGALALKPFEVVIKKNVKPS